jgi:hypothetical protein
MPYAFFLAVLPMVPSILIQSLTSIGSFGGLGIVLCRWFCRLVISRWDLQLVCCVVSFMIFLIM